MLKERRDWKEQQVEAWGCGVQQDFNHPGAGFQVPQCKAPIQMLSRVTAYVPARLFLHHPHPAVCSPASLPSREFGLFYLSL